MKKLVTKSAVILMAMMTFACASKNKSMGAGGLIGASVGGGIGALIPEKSGNERVRNVVIGSALGGIAGVIMGSAAYKNESRQNAPLNTSATFPFDAPIPPSLKKAKVESRWIEAKIVGNRYIEGHREFIIIEPAAWEER